MKLYNSLTRQVEELVPVKLGKIGLYTCGITAYYYAQIGNIRKYVNDDILRRVLTYNGYEVNHVQNVTDVGHLVSDGDEGEDKIEKGARRSGKTVWEVAQYYTDDFYHTMDLVNNLRPTVVCKATEHIQVQIDLVKKLIEKKFAYETPEAVYFEVAQFPRYDGLFGQKLAEKRVAVREEIQTGEHKKSPEDFALWFKAVGRFEKHVMVWDSPWGKGFPGWHIECSAMSMKYLGETFDIHTGGEDHLSVHHPNEIAQAEAATGKPLAKFWLHTAFLLVDGQKMSKSLGNFYRVGDVMEKGFSPMALRYLYLTANYRTQLNFTWSGLAGAQTAVDKLYQFVKNVRAGELEGKTRVTLSREKLKKLDGFKARFSEAVNNDLNLPQAVAVVWETIKSNIPDYDKLDQLLDWDQILGLKLAEAGSVEDMVPTDIKNLGAKREDLRREGKFVEADRVRVEIEKLGWIVADSKNGPVFKIQKKTV